MTEPLGNLKLAHFRRNFGELEVTVYPTITPAGEVHWSALALENALSQLSPEELEAAREKAGVPPGILV